MRGQPAWRDKLVYLFENENWFSESRYDVAVFHVNNKCLAFDIKWLEILGRQPAWKGGWPKKDGLDFNKNQTKTNINTQANWERVLHSRFVLIFDMFFIKFGIKVEIPNEFEAL